MAERRSVHLEKRQREAIQDLVERGVADNASEAHRLFVNAGMQEYGYVNGDRREDTLSGVARELGKWLAVFGAAFLAFSLFWPVEVRMWVVFFAFASVACYGAAEVLEGGAADGVRSWWGKQA